MNTPTENAKAFFIDLASMNQHDETQGFLKIFNVTPRDRALHPILASLNVEKVHVNPEGNVQFVTNGTVIMDDEKVTQVQQEMGNDAQLGDIDPFLDEKTMDILSNDEDRPDYVPEIDDNDAEALDNDDLDEDEDDLNDEIDDNRAYAKNNDFYIPTNLPSGQSHPAYVPLKVLSDKLAQIDWNAELANYLKANSGSLTCPPHMLGSLLAQAVQKVRASLWTEIAGQQAPVL